MSKSFKIKNYPDYYASDSGFVYSRNMTNNPEGRIHKLKPIKRPDGYFIVGLRKNGKICTKLLHRIIAETFIPNPENKPQVNHIDGNKQNNNVSNLEWATNSENQLHRHHVLGQKGYWHEKGGSKCPFSKPVCQIKDNKIIAEFSGMNEAERKTGVCHAGISACCRGKTTHAGGFQWKYK